MQGWKKQFLKKRRYTLDESSQTIDKVEQNYLLLISDIMRNHFLKLFMHLVKLEKQPHIDHEIQTSENRRIPQVAIEYQLSKKQQIRLTILFYRKIKADILPYQNRLNFFNEFDQIFETLKTEQKLSALQFYQKCCSKVIQKINKKAKEQKIMKRKWQIENKLQNPSSTKINFKQLKSFLCQKTYDIMEVQTIQACDLFIEGVQVADNVNIVYDKQKCRNKKTKQQIKQYRQNFILASSLKIKDRERKLPLSTTFSKMNQSRKNKSMLKQKRVSHQLLNVIKRNETRNNSKTNTRFTSSKLKNKLQPIHKEKPRLKLNR